MGITEEAGEILVAGYDANIAGNWWFITALLLIYLPLIWFVTDKIIEPRLGKWVPDLKLMLRPMPMRTRR